MRFKKKQTLKEIANLISANYVGSPDFSITGINEIHVVEKGDIVFVDHPKYYNKALNSKATTILINKKVDCPKGKALLISDDPFRDFNKITQFFNPFVGSKLSISKTSVIGKNSIIQPNVFIGDNVVIGDNCIVHSNVSINSNCTIGNNVIIGSNCVLGSDAFYYKKRTNGFDKLLSVGRVIVNDNVDLGSSCTIDRGVSGDTIIGLGTKIDNQVHIGHDTKIGNNCLIAAQTGIAGCTIIEDEVTIWGQAGIISGLTIKKGTVIMAQTGVTKSLEKAIYLGSPQREYKQALREVVYLKNVTK